MGLGGTAKKLQRLADVAEKLYEQVNEVLERLSVLHDRVEQASDDVEAVRREQRELRAVVEAIAAEQGVDVEQVLAEADLDPPGQAADGSREESNGPAE